MNNKKIVIDARLYGLENAGLGRYVINLIKELKKVDKDNQYFILLKEKYYKTLKFPKNWNKVLVNFNHYTFEEQIKLPKILNNIKPDLVHFPHFNVPIFYRGKFVVTIHDLLMHKQKGLNSTTLSWFIYMIKRVGYKIAFRKAVIGSKYVIVPSETVKNELLNVYSIDKEKIKRIYEGVDSNITQYSNSTNYLLNKYNVESNYLIYVGNSYPHKNLDIAIKAVKKTDTTLVIVSARNIFFDRLQKYIEKNNLKDRIIILNFVEDKELGYLLNNSLAFIFPSLSEGFGLPGLEAMALGTLVLASDIDVFKEVYEDNAIYFNPNKVDSIVKAINLVAKMDKNARERRITKAREFIRKYSWEKLAKETLSIYNRV